MGEEQLKHDLEQFRTDFSRLQRELAKVIVGQQETIQATLVALISGGHVLLEGVPGLGKTLLVRTLARTLRSQFARVQFTPDLMPADVVGTNVMVEHSDGSRRFEFQKGPIFANVLLADEVNRATPKTQSALLEAMQEHSVTVAGETHQLGGLFFVMATQNPLEMEGTYPLPEAQLDRFLFKLIVPFPTSDEMDAILQRTTEDHTSLATPIMDGYRIEEMSKLAKQIPIADEIRRYAIELVMRTHPDNGSAPSATKKYVRYGSSPRGAQALVLAAKIRAILDQRIHVAREDLRQMALPALRHRIILNFEGQAEGIPTDQIIESIIAECK